MSSAPAVPSAAVVLVGNPAKGSRTSAVARSVAAGFAGDSGVSAEVVELADIGAAAVASGEDRVRRARLAVGEAELLVVATPVYKASYTGLLKLLLDGLDPTTLEGTVAVPVVVSASSAHGSLADLQLRLVLQAAGALLPVPSFVVEEHHLDHLPEYVHAWQQRFGSAVNGAIRALRAPEVGAR